MSDDQNWTGGRQGIQHEQIHERSRSLEKRPLPFVGLFIAAGLLMLVEWGCYGERHLDDEFTGDLIAWCWMLLGFISALVAFAYGAKVARRMPFVYWHVMITCILVGSMASLTTLIGYPRVWLVLHCFGSAGIALSWSLPRIDSLRSAAQNGAKSVWDEAIGLRGSAKILPSEDPAHVVIDYGHAPGETRKEVVAGVAKLESGMDAHRTTVTDTPDGRTGSSRITVTLADPFAAQWRKFPGPSHPGRSFAYPLRTGYYEDDTQAKPHPTWFSFAATGGCASPLTDFAAPMETFLGLAGTTGAGKSGELNNIAAETLTRTDAILCWLDKEKILQNAGWCMDMLGMAGNADRAVNMRRAIVRLMAYRVGVFGQVVIDALDDESADGNIGRRWSPELAIETGEPAVLVIIDEADTAITDNDDWKRIFTKGRSLGIFLCLATPRASTAEVPALIQGSVGTWETFAIGDNRSKGFTLDDATLDAGADPEKLRLQGLRYLDRAPGLTVADYATLSRTYYSEVGTLRQMVLASRAGALINARTGEPVCEVFEPMPFSAGALAAMGEDYAACDPRALLLPRVADAERGDASPVTPAMPYQPTPADIAANMTPADRRGYSDDPDDDPDDEEEEPMLPTAQGVDLEEGTAAPVDQSTLYDSDDLDTLRRMDPRRPIDTSVGPDAVSFDAPGDKPVWSPEETEREFDAALTRLAAKNQETFTNGEVMEEMRCEFQAWTASRRLNALIAGARITPPGITVEPTERGRGSWRIVRSAPPRSPSPRPRSTDQEG